MDNNIVDLNVAPTAAGAFSKSSTSKIGVSTTNYTGYTLSISAQGEDNPTKLMNGDKSLSSIETAITEEQFRALDNTAYNNMWGYLPSKYNSETNTSFLPSPSTNGDILDITSAANAVDSNTGNPVINEYEITLGARVDTTASLGSYSNVFLVEAIANAIPYTITFVDNVVTDMPVDMSGTSDIDTVTISTNTPQRNGYNFIGWCTVAPTHNTDGTDTCLGPGVQIAAGGVVPLDQTSSNNNFTLYAMWGNNYTIDGVTYMQDFATMSAEKKAKVLMSMVEGQRYELKDNRDQEMYYVAKLKDGNVWMLDNLRLGGNSTITLTVANTNLDNDFTLPATSSVSSSTNAQIYANIKNNSVTSYGYGSGKIGTFYNYCAASAGTYCFSSGPDLLNTLMDAQHDVCPSGWRMPTGGNTGEYGMLFSSYNTTLEADDADSFQFNLSTPLSGRVIGESVAYQNDFGVFWSSTHDTDSRMFNLQITSSGVWPGESRNRFDALSVRCILK